MLLQHSHDYFGPIYYYSHMERNYTQTFLDHFSEHRQMVFVMGPRQSGKTTVAYDMIAHKKTAQYLSWDNTDDRDLLLQGTKALAHHMQLSTLKDIKPIICFDEIHKYAHWRDLLKGFYDSYPDKIRILVTGSAKLDAFSRGGDSLMGRYFPFRFHPLSVAEIICHEFSIEKDLLTEPKKIDDDIFQALWKFGGYPDPFLKQSHTYHRRWQNLRSQQLIQEDIRDLTRIQDLGRLELLAEYMKQNASRHISIHNLAKQFRITDKTAREWLAVLKSLYFCFEIQPYSKNIKRSLLKEPKFYLWDWSLCSDNGSRAENFIALSLLKAVHYWNDMGFSDYKLYYLRDKEKREVDFIVIKNHKPWMLIETKYRNNRSISPHLYYFQNQLKADYAIQVVIEMDYIDQTCFIGPEPLIVPAKTFLSQLV